MTPIPIIESLRQQISSCEVQLQDLQRQLAEAEHAHRQQQQQQQERQYESAKAGPDPLAHDFAYGIHDDFASEVYAALSNSEEKPPPNRWPLEKNEYRRYGRQLIMPEIGLQGTYLAYSWLLFQSAIMLHC
jgi:adenylyltransferase/sulfurtransferase